MTSYQKLREERDEWANLYLKAIKDLKVAISALWEISSLKGGEKAKADQIAFNCLRMLKDEPKKN